MCGAKQYGAGSVKSVIYRDSTKLDHWDRKFPIGMVVMLVSGRLARCRTRHAITLSACSPQDNPLD